MCRCRTLAPQWVRSAQERGQQAGCHRPGGGLSIPIAKTIKPTNTDSSIVIYPAGPQIQGGQTKIATYSNVAYSTPTTTGMATPLVMDIQVPKHARPEARS